MSTEKPARHKHVAPENDDRRYIFDVTDCAICGRRIRLSGYYIALDYAALIALLYIVVTVTGKLNLPYAALLLIILIMLVPAYFIDRFIRAHGKYVAVNDNSGYPTDRYED